MEAGPVGIAPAPGAAPGGAPVPHVRVAVVGSGFSGLGAAIQLKRDGIDDFVILERAGDVGGTWRDNTYPGCACDVPSQLYSFSFALNPGWTRSFSPQPEIQEYLRRTTREQGLLPHLRLGHELLEAAWDDERQHWRLRTSRGELTATVLILGTGPLSEPKVPSVPGLERFAGTIFHSAQWDHAHDLSGERVAVVGTGASAIQFIPHVQRQAAQVHLFQRTPPWIMPRVDRGISAPERWLFRHLPGAQRLVRLSVYWTREWPVVGFTREPRLMRLIERLARLHLRRQVPDPELRRRLTPSYTIGCKRILLSNDYYPALSRPNVEVVDGGLAEVREHSVVGADGVERPVDTIILGTGFHVTDSPTMRRVRGRGGVALAEAWREGMAAHLGTSIAGFPNLFMLVGPNTGLAHTSIVLMIESQLAYISDALRHLTESGAGALEVRAEVQSAFVEEMQERLRPTVWNSGGCASWYLDASGRNTTLWPGSTWGYRLRTRTFDPGLHLIEPARIPATASR
ncbi:MAG TPA: NAD(P)/FAD-dependent oxidoreductase [Candidatus Dormibacteraeota bacterium]|nr:NAD(P)/FAD-dependent oxidoreductase [Candidatus Dormibacteraeota bacterium]